MTGCNTITDAAACPSGSPVCVSGTSACVMAGFVVAPSGSDSNPGTAAAPFATLGHARDVVRTLDGAMTGDIAVYVRAGDYHLATSDCSYAGTAAASPAGLCLDERDSGSNGFTVRYTSYDAIGSARLIGGTAITGWQPYSGSIYRAPWTGRPFDDLFENGAFAIKARTPNLNASYGVLTTSQGPYFETLAPGPTVNPASQLSYRPSDLPSPTWNGSDGHVQIEIFSGGNRFANDTPNFNWVNDLDEVVGLDPANGVLSLRQPTSYSIPVGSRYFLQGDLSFLDAPGEYVLADGYVYYWPRATPIEDQEILAPQVKSIIQICPRFVAGEVALPTEGGLCGHTAVVHDIAITGLTLQGSEFTSEYPDRTAAGADPSGMIYLENTQAIAIEDCHLVDAGQNAIAMLYANTGNSIYGNWIERTGLSAVYVRSLRTYTGQAASGFHGIRNNKVAFVGMHQTGQIGIHLEETEGNVVSHDTIQHGPRMLIGGTIDVPAPATGNYFGYDDLYSGSEDTADDAPFYFFSICASSPCSATDQDTAHMPPKVAEQLRIDTAAWDPASQLVYPRSFPPWAFYLDNGSSNWTVSNIAVTHVSPSPLTGQIVIYNGGVGITDDNVAWRAGFDDSRIDHDNIGLRPDFPPAFDNGGVTWLDDHSPACTYTGSWLYRHDAAVSDDYAGDETYTNVAGDSVQCTFTGSELRWAASSSNNRGTADVAIDGTPAGVVDLATPTLQTQHVVYRKTGLPPGSHTITITVRGDRAPELNYVVVDALGAK